MSGKIRNIFLVLAFFTMSSCLAYASDIEIGILKDQKGNTRFEMVKALNFLGRSGRNDMIFKNIQISRRHALISEDSGSYYIEDLFSKNKTYVNGNILIPGRRIRLNPGDTIKLTENGSKFTFEIVGYDENDAIAQRLLSLKSKKYPKVNLTRLDTKKQFSFEKDTITIGASEWNDIVVTEAGIEPRQTLIILKDTPIVEDLRGRNGTRLNNKIVRYGSPRRLKSGDIITVSDKISFSIEFLK